VLKLCTARILGRLRKESPFVLLAANTSNLWMQRLDARYLPLRLSEHKASFDSVKKAA
jgi:hypothetical protein